MIEISHKPLGSPEGRAARMQPVGADVMKRLKLEPIAVAARALCLVGSAAILSPIAAWADCDVPDKGIPEDSLLSAIGPGWANVGGLRPSLAKGGVSVGANYYAEAFANSGGIQGGGKYDGVLEVYVDADMHKLGLWKGLCFHTNGYQIHGQSITASNIGSLMPVSSLEAVPSTKLFELWFEQHLYNDVVAVKVGQLAADAEFILSDGGGFFLNGTWGWPSITAADMPGGGPAYPLATPGVRVAVNPTEHLGLMIGVYNGNPAGPNCDGDPQVCDKNGTDFNLEVPALLMMEGKYNQDGRLPGQVKVGGWNNFDSFAHQRIDIGGNFIAETALSGKPVNGDHGGYVILDQLIWRVPGSEDPKGIGIFGRLIGAPADRNLVDFYAEAGITFSTLR